MPSVFKKPAVIVVVAIIVFCTLVFFALYRKSPVTPTKLDDTKSLVTYKVIGTSVQGRKIESYTYGNGGKLLLFVGGIHGGYEWNSVLLAYQFIGYLDKNPEIVPDGLTVTVIPDANPDGVFTVTGKVGNFTIADVSTSTQTLASGRFNANKVDINRNFDCKWQPDAV